VAFVLLAATICLAACSSTNQSVGHTPTSRPQPQSPTSEQGAPSTSVNPSCQSGTVTVNVAVQPVSMCVQVGTALVMTGGLGGADGSWPGPPTISRKKVVIPISKCVTTEAPYCERLKAVGVGTVTVTAPFSNKESCTPTPCTPAAPGGPLVLNVEVVR
jgi:hypothetical protein